MIKKNTKDVNYHNQGDDSNNDALQEKIPKNPHKSKNDEIFVEEVTFKYWDIQSDMNDALLESVIT